MIVLIILFLCSLNKIYEFTDDDETFPSNKNPYLFAFEALCFKHNIPISPSLKRVPLFKQMSRAKLHELVASDLNDSKLNEVAGAVLHVFLVLKKSTKSSSSSSWKVLGGTNPSHP